MSEDQPAVSVITDISANIFAVFIVILILLLAAPHTVPVRPPAPPPIDVTHDLASTSRTPLTPAQLLFERTRAGHAISIDLLPGRVVLVSPGLPPESYALPLADRSRQALADRLNASPAAPVGFYVFDHTGYAAMLTIVGGRPFSELSVPIALRGLIEGSLDWRDGFRRLIDGATDLDQFRRSLGRLLDAPNPDAADLARPRFARPDKALAPIPPPAASPQGLLGLLTLWVQQGVALTMVGLCLGLIAYVEVGRGGRRGRRSDAARR
jgi:hypothetical protein